MKVASVFAFTPAAIISEAKTCRASALDLVDVRWDAASRTRVAAAAEAAGKGRRRLASD